MFDIIGVGSSASLYFYSKKSARVGGSRKKGGGPGLLIEINTQQGRENENKTVVRAGAPNQPQREGRGTKSSTNKGPGHQIINNWWPAYKAPVMPAKWR